jgi:hypothetical protein
MTRKTIILLAVGLTAGCGKKLPAGQDAGAGAGASGTKPATPTPTPPPSAGGGGDTTTAAGGAVEDLKVVNDCPKSLQGGEKVARTIKKECGTVIIAGDYNVDGSLTLEAGVRLEVQENAEITVGYSTPAKIIVKGTAADPVTITTHGDKVAGFWKGLHLYNNAKRSSIEGLVIEYGGNDRGAIWIAADGVTLKGSTVRGGSDFGVRVDNDVVLGELSGMTFEKAGKIAMSVPPAALAGLGPGNKFDGDAVIEVREGAVVDNAKWQNAGAPYLFTGNVSIDGKTTRAIVEIAAGTELRFAEDIELAVGYARPAGLRVAGAADKPVVFTSGGEKTPGAWRGIHVYSNGDATLENAVVEYGGTQEDKGAIYTDTGSLSLKGVTVRNNKNGVVVKEREAKLKTISGCKLGPNEKLSLSIPAALFGMVAADNTYEKDQRIGIRGGEVTDKQTWLAQGAAIEVQENNVSVDRGGVLTLGPGIDLAFRGNAELSVGYADSASLKAEGAPDKPIRLHGVGADADKWKGIVLYHNAHDVSIKNVLVEDSGQGGVRADGGATAKIENLTCKKCAEATLVVKECEAKIDATGLKAEDGTPAPESKPDGCK